MAPLEATQDVKVQKQTMNVDSGSNLTSCASLIIFHHWRRWKFFQSIISKKKYIWIQHWQLCYKQANSNRRWTNLVKKWIIFSLSRDNSFSWSSHQLYKLNKQRSKKDLFFFHFQFFFYLSKEEQEHP